MEWIATNKQANSIPIELIRTTELAGWSTKQEVRIQKWLKASGFAAKPHTHCLIPGEEGNIERVLVGVKDFEQAWILGHCAKALPAGVYHIATRLTPERQAAIAITWGLGAYRFKTYKHSESMKVKLKLSDECNHNYVIAMVQSHCKVRDLINMPANDMGPQHLANEMRQIAHQYKGEFREIVGDELIKAGYHATHTVGRASSNLPRLLHLSWGEATHPCVMLVGKGVCFDSGGLDIKPSRGMLLMKKDMGGAAHVLGLSQLILSQQLPIRLEAFIPAVENVVSGNAFKPGDVIRMRDDQTIEIGNTDAEGRLILADALLAAKEIKPDLIIDLATLTGAARVAVGTDIAAFFCNDDKVAQTVSATSQACHEAVWRLPLHNDYETHVDSNIADMNNAGKYPYAGAILAALLLQRFVPPSIPWLHFDMMAWNLTNRPGRPEGGEAMVLKTLFHFIEQRYEH